jgi:hypothetical protein
LKTEGISPSSAIRDLQFTMFARRISGYNQVTASEGSGSYGKLLLPFLASSVAFVFL